MANRTVVSDYCETARPVTPLRTDDPTTKREAAREIVKFRTLCPELAAELGI